ncbi:MAG: hypothetical protein HYX92_12875 [Chloroflexi bacterium]|nr:hypothetical protein [Chloroflexota bacterium]
MRLYHWSADNSAEVERGWIKTANSIRGLAEKMRIPADNLERTVRNFNRYCLRGQGPGVRQERVS